VSGNGCEWFLINAPPDVHAQIATFPALCQQGAGRGTPIAGLLLTSADLDNALGLLTLREGPALPIHATAAIQNALLKGLSLPTLLQEYAGSTWREPPTRCEPLGGRDGTPSGLDYAAFLVDSHAPRYLGPAAASTSGDRIGYTIWDATRNSRLVVLPGFSVLDPILIDRIAQCDCLLLDGTFWRNDELQRLAAGSRTSTEMGHLPVGGERGSLSSIASLKARRTIYVHINNTNPMLNEDSPEHQAVRDAGAEVGYDGLEIEL
jgi:pyrroloquinoline quinone biosynthesis protein B